MGECCTGSHVRVCLLLVVTAGIDNSERWQEGGGKSGERRVGDSALRPCQEPACTWESKVEGGMVGKKKNL